MNISTRVLIGAWLCLAAAAPGCARLSQALNRTFADNSQQLKTQYSVARLQERQGQFVQARQNYEQIAARDPRNVEARHRLAVIHSRLGNLEEADLWFQEALDLDPMNAEIWCDLGYALYLHNDAQAAEEALRQALECNPSHQRAMNNLAMVLGQQGRFDESLAMFRRCGTDAEAHANLAYLYAQAGRGQKAIEYYSKALDLDPDLQAAKAALVQLAEMKAKVEPVAPVDPVLVAQAAEMLKQMGPLPARTAQPVPQVIDPRPMQPAGQTVGQRDAGVVHDANIVPASATESQPATENWTMPQKVQAASWANGNRAGSTVAHSAVPQGSREPGAWREEEAGYAPHVEPNEVAPREWLPDDTYPIRE